MWKIAKVDLRMSPAEFNSYTLREFDELIERQVLIRRRTFDTPAALICAQIANYAGRMLPDGEQKELDDFILRTKEEAEEKELADRDAKIRSQLELFAARFADAEED